MAFGLVSGCGYRPAYGGAERTTLSVTAGPARAPSYGALQAAISGARAELSKAGALRAGADYPRLVVELLRIDELSAGVIAEADEPRARGSSIGVVGRAWIEQGPGLERQHDTGDVRRVAHFASGDAARGDALRYADAVRAAAREVGAALARRSMGIPDAAIEPM